MPFNGSGTFTVYTPGNPIANGDTSNATYFNNTMTDFATGLSNTMTKDGQGVPTANIPMGNNKLTGLANGTVSTDAAAYGQVTAAITTAASAAQNGSQTYLTAVSGTNTITATLTGLTAYTAGLTVRFTAAGANTGAVTLNIGSLGAINVVRADGVALATGDILSAGTYEAVYDGTSFKLQGSVSASQVSAPVIASIQGMFKNLQSSSSGLSANVLVSADEIVVENTSNAYVTLRTVSLTIAGTTTGANALDTGTIAASTWYSVWVIYNGTTTAGLLSLSATAPTMPSGYTHKARVGWIRTDGTANKYPLSFKQYGRRIQYVVVPASNVTSMPRIASGAVGTLPSTYAATSVSNFVPTTAAVIWGDMGNPSINASVILAPNANYGAYNATTNPPPFWQAGGGSDYVHEHFSMVLESTNVYYISNVGSYLNCNGWEDNL